MTTRAPAPSAGNLLHRRPRASTVVLLAVFGGLLALYVIVRPEPMTSPGDGGGGGGGQPVPAPTRASATPSVEPTPSTSPTRSRTPDVTPSATPTPAEPLPSVTVSSGR